MRGLQIYYSFQQYITKALSLGDTVKRQAELPPKTLILPEKSGVPLRLYDYLCIRRGIDSEVVNTLIQKEMLYEDKRGNVVFVGHNEHGREVENILEDICCKGWMSNPPLLQQGGYPIRSRMANAA